MTIAQGNGRQISLAKAQHHSNRHQPELHVKPAAAFFAEYLNSHGTAHTQKLTEYEREAQYRHAFQLAQMAANQFRTEQVIAGVGLGLHERHDHADSLLCKIWDELLKLMDELPRIREAITSNYP